MASSIIVKSILLPIESAPIESIEVACGSQRHSLLLRSSVRWRRGVLHTIAIVVLSHSNCSLWETLIAHDGRDQQRVMYLKGDVSRGEIRSTDAKSGRCVRSARVPGCIRRGDLGHISTCSLQCNPPLALQHYNPFTASKQATSSMNQYNDKGNKRESRARFQWRGPSLTSMFRHWLGWWWDPCYGEVQH